MSAARMTGWSPWGRTGAGSPPPLIRTVRTSAVPSCRTRHARGWTPISAGLATLPMAFVATLCAPLSGNVVSRLGPRRPLLLAGTFIIAGGLCLADLGRGTSVLLLLFAYLLIGIGFGFAITNTAVGGLASGHGGRDHIDRASSRLGPRHRHRRRPGRERQPGWARTGIAPWLAGRRRLRPAAVPRR